jgi:hypothetical protein
MSTMRATSTDISVVLAVGAALAVPIVIGGAAGSDVHGVGARSEGMDVVRAGPFQSRRDGGLRSSEPSTSPRPTSARRRDARRSRPSLAAAPVHRSASRPDRPAVGGRRVAPPAAPASQATVPPQPGPAPPAPSPAVASPPPPPRHVTSPPAPPPLIPLCRRSCRPRRRHLRRRSGCPRCRRSPRFHRCLHWTYRRFRSPKGGRPCCRWA